MESRNTNSLSWRFRCYVDGNPARPEPTTLTLPCLFGQSTFVLPLCFVFSSLSEAKQVMISRCSMDNTKHNNKATHISKYDITSICPLSTVEIVQYDDQMNLQNISPLHKNLNPQSCRRKITNFFIILGSNPTQILQKFVGINQGVFDSLNINVKIFSLNFSISFFVYLQHNTTPDSEIIIHY